jgi:glucose-6-phosphate 1-dehydrogenase
VNTAFSFTLPGERSYKETADWGLIAPILDVRQALPARNFPNYAAGTWGPIEADQLLQREGHAWGDSP